LGRNAPAASIIEAFVPLGPSWDIGAAVKELTGGKGVEVVYDTVGGVTHLGCAGIAGTPRQAGGDQRRR
jgi:NADPH:quinone reductase-like Zn-dependent oxidoreductase